MRLNTKTIVRLLFVFTLLNMGQATAANKLPTGSCGALMDISHKNIQTSDAIKHGYNVLMFVDFDSLTIQARATVVSYRNTPSLPTYQTNTIGPASFVIENGPVPNTFIITPSQTSGIPTFAAMSVNNGQSFLLQVQNDRGSGVCQRN
jgi:hypothetical protein